MSESGRGARKLDIGVTCVVPIKCCADGIEVAVRVIAGAKRDEIAGERNGEVCVRLTARPVEGAGNKALLRLLSITFAVPKSAVHIAAGEYSRRKTVRIERVGPEEAKLRLAKVGITAEIGSCGP